MLDFLIVGAQKCGTTYLQSCLAQHPAIYMPAGESRIFDDPEYSSGSVADQFAKIRRQAGRKLAGIKRPTLLERRESAERIHRHCPNAKLIVLLRDPISRAVSAYFHQMYYGFLPIEPIELGLRNILDGKYHDRFPRSHEIIDFGKYEMHLVNYLRFFDREQLLVLVDKKSGNWLADAIGTTLGFLGVDPTYSSPTLGRRINKGVYSLPRLRFLRLRNLILFSYGGNPVTTHWRYGAFGRFINRCFREFDYSILSVLFDGESPHLSEELRARLYEIYLPEILRLEELLGEDLSAWKEPGASTLKEKETLLGQLSVG
jgi:hypothetical protein